MSATCACWKNANRRYRTTSRGICSSGTCARCFWPRSNQRLSLGFYYGLQERQDRVEIRVGVRLQHVFMPPPAAWLECDFALRKRADHGRQRSEIVELHHGSALVQHQRGECAAVRSNCFHVRRGKRTQSRDAVRYRSERKRDRDTDPVRLMARGAAIERTGLIGEELTTVLRRRGKFFRRRKRESVYWRGHAVQAVHIGDHREQVRAFECRAELRHPGVRDSHPNDLRDVGVVETARGQSRCTARCASYAVTVARGAAFVKDVQPTRQLRSVVRGALGEREHRKENRQNRGLHLLSSGSAKTISVEPGRNVSASGQIETKERPAIEPQPVGVAMYWRPFTL